VNQKEASRGSAATNIESRGASSGASDGGGLNSRQAAMVKDLIVSISAISEDDASAAHGLAASMLETQRRGGFTGFA
jgi:hypothetical protein